MLPAGFDRHFRNQHLKRVAAGALIGGTIGGGGSLLRSRYTNDQNTKMKRRRAITAGALGAISGGTLGSMVHNVRFGHKLERAALRAAEAAEFHTNKAFDATAKGSVNAAKSHLNKAEQYVKAYEAFGTRAIDQRAALAGKPDIAAITGLSTLGLLSAKPVKAKKGKKKMSKQNTKTASFRSHLLPGLSGHAKRTLTGAALGATAGGGTSLLRNRKDKSMTKKQKIKKALSGAAVGAAAGGLLGSASHNKRYSKFLSKAQNQASLRNQAAELSGNKARAKETFRTMINTSKMMDQNKRRGIAKAVGGSALAAGSVAAGKGKSSKSNTKTAGLDVNRYRSLASDIDKGTFGETTKEAFAGIMISLSDIVKDDTLTKSASIDNTDYIIDELSSRENRINTLLKKQVR